MLNIDTTYPGQTAGVNANYPNGQARNVTVSGDGLGTPWEQQLLNDILGFMNASVDEAGITISGSPETALASDVMDGLKAVLGLPSTQLNDLRVTRDTIVLMTTQPGSGRNIAAGNTRNLVLTASLQKQINATWVSGAGGGLPDPLTVAADTWYRRFIVGKADGSGVDLAWDTSATAANFFLDANAIAAGFTDNTLYRRYGWTLTNSSSQMDDHFSPEDDPRRYAWTVSTLDSSVTVPQSPRLALSLEHVPPSGLGILNMSMDSSATMGVLITTADQDDIAFAATFGTLRTSAAVDVNSIRGEWDVDSSSQLFARRSSATTASLSVIVDGWVDNGIIP